MKTHEQYLKCVAQENTIAKRTQTPLAGSRHKNVLVR